MAHFLSNEFGVADAVLLSEVTEDAFVSNLQLRYQKKKIYTLIGETLIAVNPYEALPIYTDAVVNDYNRRAIFEREPHIFALANAAYTNVRRSGRDTCVVISGESGAGKTESSKHLLRFVASISTESHRAEIEKTKNMLLASNPVLEAFGNAKTNRNDNSSRFGKYMDINFDFKHEPVGGHINNYLLEKARVVKQQPGERNFHVFYQLLAGAPDALLNSLKLKRDVSAYKYLSDSADSKIDDKAGFAELKTAMNQVGFSEETQTTLFKLVAAVLHIGCVQFAPNDTGCTIQNPNILSDIASLLGTDTTTLQKALTIRVRAGKEGPIESPLTNVQAEFAREALAKSLYERMFSWLVQQINTSLAPPAPAPGSSAKNVVLGVLDIYGFEVFAQNGFEQFCINYCNEKLQQLFIELVLKQEQAEYASEGITWVEVPYFDNAAICSMVDHPKEGIISVLDEQYQRGNGTDGAFLAHMDTVCKGNARYTSFQKDAAGSGCRRDVDFCIRHFAGDVKYDVTGFVDKNNDAFFHDLKRMLYGCSLPALKEMWPEGADSIMTIHKNPASAGTIFKQSMHELSKLLLSKDPFYVRCIKPNDSKAKNSWDNELCQHQVRYLGLMENLKVRRAGYCNRQVYKQFVERYKMLAKKTWPNFRGDAKTAATHIIEETGLKSEVAFGTTKIFIKAPHTLAKLEQLRDAKIPLLVARMQAGWRGLKARRRVHKMRAVYKIMSFYFQAKRRAYVRVMLETFSGVAQRPDLGKGLQWPTVQPSYQEATSHIKKIWATWRAKKILKRFTPEQAEDIKKKIIAQNMLNGRRKAWGFAHKWVGNHIADTPNAPKFGAAVAGLFEKNGDTKVVFAAEVLKLNKKGKQDERVLAVTDKHIYRMDKTFKCTKNAIPLSEVVGFAMSTSADQALVIKLTGGNDLVVTLRGNAIAPEAVAIISQAHGNLSLPVQVDQKVTMSQAGATKNLSFTQADESKTHFARRESGFAVVTRKASVLRFEPRKAGNSRANLIQE